jgi:hypothetical protein
MPNEDQELSLKRLRKRLADVLARLDDELAQNAVLIEQVAKLNERIGELLPDAQRKRCKQPTATPAADVKTAAVDAATRKAFDERPLPPPKPDEPATEKRPCKPTGRKPASARGAAQDMSLPGVRHAHHAHYLESARASTGQQRYRAVAGAPVWPRGGSVPACAAGFSGLPERHARAGPCAPCAARRRRQHAGPNG